MQFEHKKIQTYILCSLFTESVGVMDWRVKSVLWLRAEKEGSSMSGHEDVQRMREGRRALVAW
jgi:hypothetical protein